MKKLVVATVELVDAFADQPIGVPIWEDTKEYTAKPGRPWYCAQKAALINLARAMALDHARQNIRVNSLSLGPIETRRFISNFESLEAARAANDTLLDRLGRPEEFADGTVFLASDESSFMTGADLLIDGGYSAV